MAKKIEKMSAEELFALAAQRAEEEAQAAREEVKEQITELRNKKKELQKQFKKELAAVDAEIRKLSGRGGKGGGRSGRAGAVTDVIVQLIGDAGQISTKDIKAALEAQGVVAGNLNQTLAYLKRQGRISSPSRSIYQLA